MPTPILRIPIDDAAVQRYFSTFAKYQVELAKQPEVWKGINDGMGGMAAAGAAIAAEIAHQAEETRKLATEEAKREEAQKKADKEQKDRDKEAADREKDAATRRKKAIADVREYSRGLADAAINLGKWALLGESAGLAAGALSLWGLDKLAAGAGQELRAAQGVGVTISQRQGLGLNMQRYFDVNSVLENVANAQATPSQWGLFRMMGVDPHEDPARLTGDMAIAARRMFLRDNGNLALAGAQGLTQIFSPDDLRRLTAPGTTEADIRQSIKDSNANEGLSDQVAKKWQTFMVTMDTAGLKLKNDLIERLADLQKPLTDLVGSFTTLALEVLNKPNLDAMASGIETFAKYIGSPKFRSDVSTFIDDVGLVAKKIADALVLLNIIPDPKAPDKMSPGGGAVPTIGGAALGASIGGVFGPLGAAAGAAIGAGVGFMYGGAEHSRLVQLEHDYGLPSGSLHAIYGMESAYGKNPGLSSAGALGPFQIMPDTAKQYGVTDRTSFQQESTAAAKIMRDELKRYHGDLKLALAAYDWGPGNVDRDLRRYGSGWLNHAPKETRDYVKRGIQLTVHNKSGNDISLVTNSTAAG